MTKKHFLLSLAIIGAVLVISGCTKGTDWTVNAMLNNQSSEAVYMWVGEDRAPQPSDRVEPGQFRSIQIGFSGREGDGQAYFDDNIRMHASKDGKTVFRSETNGMSQSYVAGKPMYVRWSGNGFQVDY